MQAKVKQISFSDIYSDIENCIVENKPKLIKLFEEHINLEDYIPQSFYSAYYSNTGHPRDFKLTSMLCALIIQKLLSIPETNLLINILNLSKELRNLCGFSRVPNASQFSRFKADFVNHLHDFFNSLVSITEPICHEINLNLSNILIVDTTGFEGYVQENNPKFFDTLLRNSKKLEKFNKDFNAHSYACSKMPKHSSANPDLKLSYINGHYCYSQKAAIATNGLGIVRHVDFYDAQAIEFDKAASAEEAKDDYDAKSLIPVLKNFFNNHRDFKYKYFLGDKGFDAYDNYKFLVKEHNITPIIPLNHRNSKDLPSPAINEFGIPTCPNDPSLAMKYDGTVKEKNRPLRIKWLCPKTTKIARKGKTTYECSCSNPCTDSTCGRIYHTYPDKNYRMNTIVPRDSELWNSLFKLRTIIERTIYMLKYPLCCANTKLRNTSSIKADVLLACITQQFAVILASKLNKSYQPLSIKSLIA